ncbi:hypothetical protein OSTOST_16653 [Ostertagia ostertagi]
MFIPTLQAQCADDQMHWLEKAMTKQIIGTYAQTELGHGTNLKKLETTATYDAKTKEFVLHSPTRNIYEVWRRNLGKSANHAVVVACLIIDGQNYGPHNFVVPLRDAETHEPLKACSGPKMATMEEWQMVSWFRSLRSRDTCLMKHVKTPEGKYIRPVHAKIGYSAMVHVRAHMISTQAAFLAQALTTAIRYSAVRRQGEIQPGKGEVKILEYQTQQHRLFPQLARAYAFIFTGQAVRVISSKEFKRMSLWQSNRRNGQKLHYITSGLKAVVTHLVGQGIEQARMSCGGHGYSKASNMSELYGVAIGGATYEGENMVMLQQLARYLMKSAEAAKMDVLLENLLTTF